MGLCVDGHGTIHLADFYNFAIRAVTPEGVVSTFAGTPGTPGAADGAARTATFFQPWAVAVGPDGTRYVADDGVGIRVITPAGVVSTLKGKLIQHPAGVAVDAAGNVYVADQATHAIAKITPDGVVQPLAGQGSPGHADGDGSAASFNGPRGLVLDAGGTTLYVADTGNHLIRTVALPGGTVRTLAGTLVPGCKDGPNLEASFFSPWYLALDGAGNLFVTDNATATIRKLSPAGTVTTVLGVPGVQGNAFTARIPTLSNPHGLALVPGTGALLFTVNDALVTLSPPPEGW